MATWNSRGLRGSTLEEFINLTNEKYAEHGLALIQKVPTPIPLSKSTRAAGILPWLILNRKAPWIILGQCRASPYALTPRSAIPIRFPCRTSTPTKSGLWNSLKGRAGFLFCWYFIPTGMNFIICAAGKCWNFGTGRKRAEGKASGMRSWSRNFSFHPKAGSWCHIWM